MTSNRVLASVKEGLSICMIWREERCEEYDDATWSA